VDPVSCQIPAGAAAVFVEMNTAPGDGPVQARAAQALADEVAAGRALNQLISALCAAPGYQAVAGRQEMGCLSSVPVGHHRQTLTTARATSSNA
jgi:hypothetical protein